MMSRVEVYRRFAGVFCLLHQSCYIALMMEAESSAETLVNFYKTARRNMSEDSHRHTRRHENLKYYLCSF
jgi:hypothetical protein